MKRILLAICLATAVGGCGRRGDDYSVAGLMKKLRDGDSAARYSAVSGLKAYGPEGRPAVDLLTQALKDSDRNIRVEAAYALAAIGPDAEAALPRLMEMLKSPDADTRLAGTYAVPIVGVRSSSSAAAMKPVLGDRDPRVRAEAASGLRKLQLAARFKNAAPTAAISSAK